MVIRVQGFHVTGDIETAGIGALGARHRGARVAVAVGAFQHHVEVFAGLPVKRAAQGIVFCLGHVVTQLVIPDAVIFLVFGRQAPGQRTVDQCAFNRAGGGYQAVIPCAHCQPAAGSGSDIRCAGDQVDGAAGGVLAVQGTLWST